LYFCSYKLCGCLVVSVDELIQSSDSEIDEGLMEEPLAKRSRRAARDEKRSKAWLKEDEDIVDFLDPSAARKVVGKRFFHHNFVTFVVRFRATVFEPF